MKRDTKLQREILRKIESQASPAMLFTKFQENAVGFEEEITAGWSEDEVYNIRLLVKDGKLSLEKVTDGAWFGGAPDDPYAETYIALTTHGHEFIDQPSWWQRAYQNVAHNLATLITAVIIAVTIQYILKNLNLD